LISNY